MKKSTMASLAIGSTLALAPATTRAQVQPTLSSAPPASALQTPATVDTGTAVADGDPAQIGDIIVTAERRATTAQKTPISISVVSGGDLARTGTVDLAKAVEEVPAVQVQRSNTGASFYIRGIGSRGVGGSSPVSVNEDGIYQQQPDVISAAFTDLDRIEVLRGPQGTLYGRNANGGTINVITRNPVLGEYSGDVTLGFGNYDTIQSMGAVNVPIGSTLAIRLVGDVERHDGYLTNGLSDRNDKVVRGKLLWQPVDRFKLLLSAEELSTDSKGPSNVLLSDNVADPYYAAPYDSFNVVFTGDPVYCSPVCRPSYRVRNKQYRAEASYDLGFGVLTGLTGIQRYHRRYLQAFAGGIEYDDQPLDQKSYEVRLASEANSPIQWVAGLYALDQDYSGETKYVYHIDAATIYAINVTRSRAAFGQATLPITDRLRLTGGLRYTEDRYRKRVDSGVVDGTTATLTSLTTGTLYTNRYSKVTYKGAVEYDLTPRSLLYGQYSTGFRSGGVDERGSVFGPETIRSFEVGLKNRFFGNTLQLNASAYYYLYGGYQLDYAISVGGAATDIITTSNVSGTTRVWGGEVELEYRPGKADRIQASANYQGSRFSDVTLPTSCDRSGTCTYTALGGRSLPRTPKWTATLGYEHSFELPSGGSLVPHVDGQYKSGYESDLLSFTYSYQHQYMLGNARLIYNLPGERLSISAYVNNFTNKAVIEQANTAGPVDRYGVLNDPRTYGVALTGHF